LGGGCSETWATAPASALFILLIIGPGNLGYLSNDQPEPHAATPLGTGSGSSVSLLATESPSSAVHPSILFGTTQLGSSAPSHGLVILTQQRRGCQFAPRRCLYISQLPIGSVCLPSRMYCIRLRLRNLSPLNQSLASLIASPLIAVSDYNDDSNNEFFGYIYLVFSMCVCSLGRFTYLTVLYTIYCSDNVA